MPKVSVIMPAYNAEKYIKEAIDSILGQTFEDFEFIILNDCSQDRTEQIIQSYSDSRIVYLKNEQNMGVAATLNRGLEVATGEYIARMDADDISMAERFAQQVAYLDQHPETVLCGANAVIFGEMMSDTRTDVPCNDRKARIQMAITNPFIHPVVMMQKKLLNGLRYDRAFEGREDYRMWMVLSQNGKMANLSQPLLRYRSHGAQVTQREDDEKVQKHFRLKKTYYQELNIGLKEEEQDALCQAAFYGKVKDVALLEPLKTGLIRLARHYGCRRLPAEYDMLLYKSLRNLNAPVFQRWKLSAGLSLRNRLRLFSVKEGDT